MALGTCIRPALREQHNGRYHGTTSLGLTSLVLLKLSFSISVCEQNVWSDLRETESERERELVSYQLTLVWRKHRSSTEVGFQRWMPRRIRNELLYHYCCLKSIQTCIRRAVGLHFWLIDVEFSIWHPILCIEWEGLTLTWKREVDYRLWRRLRQSKLCLPLNTTTKSEQYGKQQGLEEIDNKILFISPILPAPPPKHYTIS